MLCYTGTFNINIYGFAYMNKLGDRSIRTTNARASLSVHSTSCG